MKPSKVPDIASLPSKVDIDVRRAFDTIRGFFNELRGKGGAVSLEDLKSSGLTDNQGNLPEGLGDYSIPPALEGLTANGAFLKIILDWTPPNYKSFAYVEIFRNTVDNLGTALRIGSTPAAVFTDVPPQASLSVDYYYWVRAVNQRNVTGPYNALAGTVASTASDPEYLMDLLTKGDEDVPFFALDVPTVINGVTVPAGAYIRAAFIADATITNAKIKNLAVDTAKIADATITNAKIADLAVNTAKIANAAITNAKIGVVAIGTAQIADAAITNAKIGSAAVGTLSIAGNAVSVPIVGVRGYSVNNSGIPTVDVVLASVTLSIVDLPPGGVTVLVWGLAKLATTGFVEFAVKGSSPILGNFDIQRLGNVDHATPYNCMVGFECTIADSYTFSLTGKGASYTSDYGALSVMYAKR